MRCARTVLGSPEVWLLCGSPILLLGMGIAGAVDLQPSLSPGYISMVVTGAVGVPGMFWLLRTASPVNRALLPIIGMGLLLAIGLGIAPAHSMSMRVGVNGLVFGFVIGWAIEAAISWRRWLAYVRAGAELRGNAALAKCISTVLEDR